MQDLSKLKYRAFLSYAHVDQDIATRLHKKLEAFRLGKKLAGQVTAFGPAPERLSPIFHDREDFPGGQTLKEATIAALDESAALIVLCSPVAASRPAVNEEVRLFRHRHPDRPVIPVILRDKVPDVFPPALRFALDADGAVTETPVEVPLCPDLNPGADGEKRVLAKIAAGVTGLPLVDVTGRMNAQDQQFWMRWGALLSAVAVLLAALLVVIYRSESAQAAIMERMIKACEQKIDCNVEDLRKSGVEDAIKSILGDAAEGDAGAARVKALLEAGKIADAAELEEQLADARGKENAAAYRRAAFLFLASSRTKARNAFAKAMALDPTDRDSRLWFAWLSVELGQLAQAEDAYAAFLKRSGDGVDDPKYAAALTGLGDIALRRGDLAGAKARYEQGLKIRERLARDESDAEAQRDLSVSYERLGDILGRAGDLAGAKARYEQGLNIFERLARDESDAQAQRDLSVSYIRLGDILARAGDLAGAKARYEQGLKIFERLARDESDARAQRDLSVSYARLGDMLERTGDVKGAIGFYEKSLPIASRIARANPSNPELQNDLAITNRRLAELRAKAAR
jgi:tetratricopeptide (TPR) repeat protein